MDEHGLICKVETVTSNSRRQMAGEPPAEQSHVHGPLAPTRKNKGRLAFLWGVSGTVVSAVGFIGLTLFQQYSDSLNELRRDLKHFNEASADLVKKESLQKCRERIRECLKEMRDSAVVRAQMERALRVSEEDKKETTREMQRLRERVASMEGRQAATTIVVPAVRPDAAKDGENKDPSRPQEQLRQSGNLNFWDLSVMGQ